MIFDRSQISNCYNIICFYYKVITIKLLKIHNLILGGALYSYYRRNKAGRIKCAPYHIPRESTKSKIFFKSFLNLIYFCN